MTLALPASAAPAFAQFQRLSPEVARRVMVYCCALALIAAGNLATAAPRSMVCSVSKSATLAHGL